MINNFNPRGTPDNNPNTAPTAAVIEGRQTPSAAIASSEQSAQSPVALAAQRAATAMSAYAPQIAHPSLTRAGQSSSSLGFMNQQYSTHLLESTQPSPYLGDRRYPLIQIRTGTALERVESSRKIADMLMAVMKASQKDRRNSEVQINPNYQTSEFTFFAHQFALALQLDPHNPELIVIANQLSKPERDLLASTAHLQMFAPPARASTSRATPQAIQQASQRAIPPATPPANPRGRPPITPPPRANTRPLTTPPSGPLANPESKRVKAEESNAV